MIKHIVMFRFTDDLDKEGKIELAKELAKIFSPLATLKSVNDFKTGINFNEVTYAWDFIIDSTFIDRESLEEYQVSREHQEAIRKAAYIAKEKAVVDYDF
jgi:hypothetical protein